MAQSPILALVVFMLCAVRAYSGTGRADFLICKNPASIALFDKYEEPLSVQDKKALPINSPLQIIDEKTMFGDGFTPAVKVLFLGKALTLRKADVSGFKRYSGCTLLGDTGSIVSFGERVVRIFNYRGEYCLLSLENPERFEFRTLAEGAFQPLKKRESAVLALLTEGDRAQVRERLENANQTYKRFFDFFNGRTGQDKAIPVWSWTPHGEGIRCLFQAPVGTIHALSESTQYLIRDIENIFIGKPVRVEWTGNELLIQPHTEAVP